MHQSYLQSIYVDFLNPWAMGGRLIHNIWKVLSTLPKIMSRKWLCGPEVRPFITLSETYGLVLWVNAELIMSRVQIAS